MRQPISKYHGLGNDFVVMDRRESGVDLTAEVSRALCDRRRGIGADGVLVLLPSAHAFAKMVVHNADGSIAEMCGNGLRCAVKHLADHHASTLETLDVETGAGVLSCRLFRGADARVSEVEISMGAARLLAPNLPSGDTGRPFVQVEVQGHPGVIGTAVSMGNPHLVLLDRPLEEAPLLGPRLEHASGFRDRTNVEFVRFDSDGLTVVVWERGCGLTDACGTGACASVAAAVHLGRLKADAWHRVALPGGTLSIRVSADLNEVRMRGPVAFVFDAVVTLPDAR